MISNQDIREQIVKELELGGLPEEAQNEIIAKFSENLLKKIAIAMLDKIPSDKRSEFEAIVGNGDSNAMYSFIKTNVPDADALMKTEIQKSLAEIKQPNN